MNAARLAALFPAAVVEGMLAAIGLLIIVKQMPSLLGTKFAAHDFSEYVPGTPAALGRMNPLVFGLGVFSLAVVFGLSAVKARWAKLVPAPVVMVVVATVASLFIGLGAEYRIAVPSLLDHHVTVPDFSGLFADRGLWWAVAGVVVTLTLIDGVESLATATAVDKIDPYHRKSDPNGRSGRWAC